MINAIGAIHTAMRTKTRPEDEIGFRVEIKKRRRRREQDDGREPPRQDRNERGTSV